MDMVTRADASDAAPADRVSPVNSHNEWDPLEEVIVGRLEGAVIPSDHPVVTCNIPGMAARAQSLFAGFHYPKIMTGLPEETCAGAIKVPPSRAVVTATSIMLILIFVLFACSTSDISNMCRPTSRTRIGTMVAGG
jgi:glycine amidinotransferase